MSAASTKISTKFTPAVNAAAVSASEAFAAKSPSSVLTIPSSVRYGPVAISDLKDENGRTPAACIRQIGTTRRIFVLDPHMTTDEMDGLAHRIQILSRNSGLNSILLTNNLEKNSDDEVDYLFPASALEYEKSYNPFEDMYSPKDDSEGVWNVSNGYDVRALSNTSFDEKRHAVNALMKLALSIKGGKATHSNTKKEYISKIPFISLTHGSLSDGGYALAMGTYALVTSASRFQITNPQKGLSLDPIGLSYILPRLGFEFQHPCSKYPLGSVFALTGYVADGADMVESGLATHFVDSVESIAVFERALSELKPYNQQRIRKSPVRQYGYVESESNPRDDNAQYRNVAVANLVHSFSWYDSAGQDYTSFAHEKAFLSQEDPSLVLEHERGSYLEDRTSMLITIAATFEDLFKKEDSIQGIYEGMKAFASAEARNEEEVEFVELAKELLNGMESQSPLALHAVHRLLMIGKGNKQSLESCMEREKSVLLKMFEMDDFKNWAKSGLDAGEFKDWKHKSVHEVTTDEVMELFKD